MRLATFELDAQRHIGVAHGDGYVVDVSDIVGDDIIRLIRQADHMLPQLARAVSSDQFPSYAEDNIRWLPPVPMPGKICGVAMNNSESGERKVVAPDHPAFFLKPSSCLVGHREPIRLRRYYGSAYPEPELAVVIGKTARDIDAAQANDYIFGYTVFNDITGHAMRCEDLFRYKEIGPDEIGNPDSYLSYMGRAKGSDTFGCMGPWLVTADEVANVDELGVQCIVGGEMLSESSTRYYNYKVPELVSFISQYQTLEPGDVISCGALSEPSAGKSSIDGADLQQVSGPVDVCIEALGTLSNPVVVEDRDIGSWRLPRES